MASASPLDHTLCRFCLRIAKPVKNLDNELYEFIQEILLVKISSDDLLICTDCFLMWEMFREFLSTCLLANTILQTSNKTIPTWIGWEEHKPLVGLSMAVKSHYGKLQALVSVSEKRIQTINHVQNVAARPNSNNIFSKTQSASQGGNKTNTSAKPKSYSNTHSAKKTEDSFKNIEVLQIENSARNVTRKGPLEEDSRSQHGFCSEKYIRIQTINHVQNVAARSNSNNISYKTQSASQGGNKTNTYAKPKSSSNTHSAKKTEDSFKNIEVQQIENSARNVMRKGPLEEDSRSRHGLCNDKYIRPIEMNGNSGLENKLFHIVAQKAIASEAADEAIRPNSSKVSHPVREHEEPDDSGDDKDEYIVEIQVNSDSDENPTVDNTASDQTGTKCQICGVFVSDMACHLKQHIVRKDRQKRDVPSVVVIKLPKKKPKIVAKPIPKPTLVLPKIINGPVTRCRICGIKLLNPLAIKNHSRWHASWRR